MRTVSFSPANIRETLKTEFVCHTINTEGDPSAGQSHAHAPNDKAGSVTDGVANQNVQLLFLTPNGEIFHTVSGFRGPDALAEELSFSIGLFNQIQEDPKSAKELVQVVHQTRQRSTSQRSSRSRPRPRRRSGGGSIRRSLQLDYTFAEKYPMLAMSEFEKNPRLLVGTGTSMFVSGSATGGKIGLSR
ncbi:MAG: hypothetical protein AB8G99_25855 [Planctomycetaceae bacterium]